MNKYEEYVLDFAIITMAQVPLCNNENSFCQNPEQFYGVSVIPALCSWVTHSFYVRYLSAL